MRMHLPRIAQALAYREPTDASAVTLGALVEKAGAWGALEEIASGLPQQLKEQIERTNGQAQEEAKARAERQRAQRDREQLRQLTEARQEALEHPEVGNQSYNLRVDHQSFPATLYS